MLAAAQFEGLLVCRLEHTHIHTCDYMVVGGLTAAALLFPSPQVVDRYLLARLLQQLQGLQLPGCVSARGPAFCEASGFDGCLVEAVTAAGGHGAWW